MFSHSLARRTALAQQRTAFFAAKTQHLFLAPSVCLRTVASFSSASAAADVTGLDQTGLVGSVRQYEKHVAVFSGRKSWPSKIEDMSIEMADLTNLLSPLSVKLTALDASSIDNSQSTSQPDRTEGTTTPSTTTSVGHSQGRDIIIYPDMLVLRQVKDLASIAGVLYELAEKRQGGIKDRRDGSGTARAWNAIEKLPVTETHVLVCTHGERDCRCGDHGSAFYEALKSELQERGLEEMVKVCRTSHIGGHKFAGNAIVYPQGHWYGLLKPADASDFVDSLVKNQVLWSHWRGCVGLSPEEQHHKYEQHVAKSSDATKRLESVIESWEPSTKRGKEARKTDSPDNQRAGTVRVTFITSDGERHTLFAPPGKLLMSLARENDIDGIEAACGGNVECATCHVIVESDHFDRIPPPTTEEEDMLDYAVGLEEK
ncbi:hypothetical protein HK102_006384 [Quaeritorhiza haematococci]|nr:hypothetical protein HK102_006384 [Quaeritorhiza haematococci]